MVEQVWGRVDTQAFESQERKKQRGREGRRERDKQTDKARRRERDKPGCKP